MSLRWPIFLICLMMLGCGHETVEQTVAAPKVPGGAFAAALAPSAVTATAVAPAASTSSPKHLSGHAPPVARPQPVAAPVRRTILRPGLSGDQIWDTVGAAMGQVRACYERSLKADPGLAGRMTVTWRVLPDGSVSGAAVKGKGLGDPELSRCIERRVTRWRFPTSARATPVELPFTLRPSS
ncbi:MAG: AgmX/PglI C-terminal domain-containing protein [Myxococcota bacterium]